MNRLPKGCVEDVDRYGNVRIYYRKVGQRKIRLEGIPWSPAFMEAYAKAEAGEAIPKPKPRQPAKPGTVKALLESYYASPEFKDGLDPRTQRVRRGILDKIGMKAGELPYSQLDHKNIRKWRDARADRPEAANALVKALRQLFAHAIETMDHTRNPAKEVKYLKSRSNGFHSWTLEEVEAYEAKHPIGTSARLALALLLYTGQRRSDIVLFGPGHVREGWIHFTQQKNRNSKPITLDLPIVPELQQIIDATPSGKSTFLVTEFGKGFTANGFGNRMRKWCDEAGLPQCAAHGLRKAAASRLAEDGKSEAEIQAVTGHQTSKEVTRYTKAARQKILAGRALGVHHTVPLSSPKTEELDNPAEKPNEIND